MPARKSWRGIAKQQRDYQRYRRRGTTTERGYHSRHQAERKRRLATWKPGDPCARCGQPMWSRWTYDRHGNVVSAIDLGHTADRTAYTGLEHRSCNRRDGQRKTTAVLRAAAQGWRTSRAW